MTDKSFWEKAKGLVVETVPGTEEVEVIRTVGPRQKSDGPPQGMVNPYVPPVVLGAADPEILKILEEGVSAAAQPAYSQFLIMSNALASTLTDESTRFQAALAAIAPAGLTKDAVLIDVDECLQALDKKEQDNKAAVAKARDNRVGSREVAFANLTTKIADLQNEINTITLDRDRLSAEIRTETQDIDSTERRFSATVAAYRAELIARKAKISTLRGK